MLALISRIGGETLVESVEITVGTAFHFFFTETRQAPFRIFAQKEIAFDALSRKIQFFHHNSSHTGVLGHAGSLGTVENQSVGFSRGIHAIVFPRRLLNFGTLSIHNMFQRENDTRTLKTRFLHESEGKVIEILICFLGNRCLGRSRR